MKKEGFSDSSPGDLVEIGKDDVAFIPSPLPPEVFSSDSVAIELEKAIQSIGLLQGRGKDLPNLDLLIQPLHTLEALASSRIEGTVAEPQELAMAASQAQEKKIEFINDDTLEVLNYQHALSNAINMLPDMPISDSMIRGIHTQLLNGLSEARGARKNPGEYRKKQCHIVYDKEIRFTPPPVLEVKPAMAHLVEYINREKPFAASLIDAALIHYQFETIHPFDDGNGRVGRILIPIYLITRGMLKKERPLFYPSVAIERRRQEYIDRLLEVSRSGDWMGWIRFFLQITQETCEETLARVEKIFSLLERYKTQFSGKGQTRLPAELAEYLFERPVVSIGIVERKFKVTYPTAKRMVERLVAAKILQEFPLRRKPKLFYAPDIIALS
ncbi:MAG: Fic family protein [Hyphomicrobiales bacterium]|nr:Fic family protein [Hyphomicrobiales bacterium]